MLVSKPKLSHSPQLFSHLFPQKATSPDFTACEAASVVGLLLCCAAHCFTALLWSVVFNSAFLFHMTLAVVCRNYRWMHYSWVRWLNHIYSTTSVALTAAIHYPPAPGFIKRDKDVFLTLVLPAVLAFSCRRSCSASTLGWKNKTKTHSLSWINIHFLSSPTVLSGGDPSLRHWMTKAPPSNQAIENGLLSLGYWVIAS